MIIAAAQTNPKQGDIFGNLKNHYEMIELASDNGAQLIVFPEMSLTGYEREKAHQLSFSEDDPRLDDLKKLSTDKKMIIIAGAPIEISNEIFIGSFILQPDGSASIYTKQHLHTGEEKFFASSFAYNPFIELNKEKISLAICADIENPLHPESAKKRNSTIYIASIFYTPGSIDKCHQLLSGYAKKYTMNVLMSNFCGKSWESEAGGKSAFWNSNGELITALDNQHPGLLIVEKENAVLNWKKKTISGKHIIM